MKDVSLYVYCFARPQPLAGFTTEGLEPGFPITLVPWEKFCAVVSVVTPTGYIDLDSASTNEQLKRVFGQTVRHLQVVSAVFHRSPVVQLPSGTVLPTDETKFAHWVTARAAIVEKLLAKFAECQQFTLGYCVDARTSIEWLAKNRPDLRKAYREHSGTEQKEEVMKEIWEWMQEAFAEVRKELEPDSKEFTPVEEAKESKKKTEPQPMFWSSFLVARDRLSSWKRRLDGLNTRFKPAGLTLTVGGPEIPTAFTPNLAKEPK
jgi:Gas vesicle synthesis protein GvpL/GvpF